MTVPVTLPVDDDELRALCLSELLARGLPASATEQELLVAVCVDAYRQDLARALAQDAASRQAPSAH